MPRRSTTRRLIWIYYDTTARALSPKIRKYVQAQSWFQDLALVEM
jgi:peptide/nickel transport system substrate-binding protein